MGSCGRWWLFVTPDRRAASDVRRVSTLLGLLFGLAGMGSAAAAMAIGPLAGTYDVGEGAAAWSISLYALTFGVATAVYGRVADLSGPRMPMLVGLSLMTFGAAVAALAPTFELHLVARLFQGAGAAAVPTLGAAVVSARYAGDVKSAALLRMASIAAAVSCLGPLAGGVVVDTLGWRGAIALPILGILVIPPLWSTLHVGGTGARLDIVGAVLTALAAGGVVLLVQSPSTGPVVAVVGLVLLVVGAPLVAMRVRSRPHGFLPVAVVRNPVVVRSALAASAIPASWFALLVAVPAILLGLGWEAWQVGLAIVPSGVVGLLAPRFSGPFMARIGPARCLMVSAAVAAVTLLVAGGGAALKSPPLLVLAVIGATLSFGLGQPSLTAAVGNAVAEDVRGVALGIATLVFMVGGSVGSAVVGGIGHSLGLDVALAVLALLPVIGILLVLPTRRAERRPATV
jgi:MFS family permease